MAFNFPASWGPFPGAQFPYTQTGALNMDWVIWVVKNLIAEWKQTAQDWETQQEAFDSLKSYVENYFKNLDVQDEIDNKLDQMFASGVFAHMLSGYCPDWYGADTTGETDASAAFQAAFDDAAENGGYVFLNPQSKYLLETNVVAKSSIDGMGATVTCTCPSTSEALTLENIFLFGWSNMSGFFVKNLHIVENTSEQIAKTLYTNKFFFDGCSFFTLENCSYTNDNGGNAQNGFDVYGNCHHFSIKNFAYHVENASNGGNWVRAISGDTYSGIVENCSFYASGFSDEALAVWPQVLTVHDIAVKNCNFEYHVLGTNKTPVLILMGGTVGTADTQNSYNLSMEDCKITADFVPRNIINCYANAGTQPQNITLKNCTFEVSGSDEWIDSTPVAAYALIRLHPTTKMEIFGCEFTAPNSAGSRGLVRSNGPVYAYDSIFNTLIFTSSGCCYNSIFNGECVSCDMVGCSVNVKNTTPQSNVIRNWRDCDITNDTSRIAFFISTDTHIHGCRISGFYIDVPSPTPGILSTVDVDYTHFINCTFTANIKAPEITGTTTYNYGYVQPG